MKLRALLIPLVVVAFAVTLAGCATPLTGTFRVGAGKCTTAGVTSGSYFRMIQPGGTATTGPFLANPGSTCGDKTFTALKPGTDGGLKTGVFQPQPTPGFDAAGNSLAGRIIKPIPFFGVLFGVSTNAIDPQTSTAVAEPNVGNQGGSLTGNFRALDASWNNQHFNQGSPKPDWTKPGITAGPTGRYNATKNTYSLDWTSLIVGGPFDGFTGKWHFEGTFQSS